MAACRDLGDAQRTLELVRAALSLGIHYRNDYEANNAYASNVERLDSIGTFVEKPKCTADPVELAKITAVRDEAALLRTLWDVRRQDYEKQKAADLKKREGTGESHEEWLRQVQAEDAIDEENERMQSKQKKKKGKGSKGGKKGDVAGDAELEFDIPPNSQREGKHHGMERGASLAQLMHPVSNDQLTEEVVRDVQTMKPARQRGGSQRSTPQPQSRSPIPQSSPATSGAPSQATPPDAPQPKNYGKNTKPADDRPLSLKTVATQKDCVFGAVPPEVLAGSCYTVNIPNTPLVELQFTSTCRGHDDEMLYCHVTAHRVAIASIVKATPPPLVTPTAKVVAPFAAGGPPRRAKSPQPHQRSSSNPPSESEEELHISSSDSEQGNGEGAGAGAGAREEMHNIVSFEDDDDEYDVLQGLSRKLVEVYNANQTQQDAEFEQLNKAKSVLPLYIPQPMPQLLKLSTAPWVVLMCHGGYFAGAIFVNSTPVLHRCIHRYIVRKKQGGKQSKHENAGGSLNSAGSQIRHHHEVKWKLAIRETVRSWAAQIESAWVILYVAPGPDNRAILSDFSDLPSCSGMPEKSPIDLKDPRVHSAPLTTHRPTFQEVQRIFYTVSRCTVRYKEPADPEGGDGSPSSD